MEEVFVLSAVRTPIGKYGGGLASVPPCDLAAQVVREAVSRAGVSADDVGHVVFGNVIHTEVRDMYISRVAAAQRRPEQSERPALTVNRLCGSGMQAIVSAAQMIMLGDCDVAVAGGAESMSRAPYWLPAMRWGQRMNDGVATDPMVGALSDPFDGCHMGVTAENVATDFGVSRADQDALAAESHRRAAAATAAGYFKEQILPVEIPGRKGPTTIVDTDEHVRPEVSLDDMAKLQARVRQGRHGHRGQRVGHQRCRRGRGARLGIVRDQATASPRSAGWPGTVTPESSRGSWAWARCPRRARCWTGPVSRLTRSTCSRSTRPSRPRRWPWSGNWTCLPERTNPNGSGISLGHPVGASGAILVVKSLYELKRTGGRYALNTMCIGGGQGIATIFERV